MRGWFYGLTSVLCSYSLVFICGWRIQVALSHKTALFETKKAQSAQRQLNYTIWMQALIPFCVCGTSLIFFYFAIRTNLYKLEAFTLQFYSFMVFPILNPIISILFISAYRRSYINFWRRLVAFSAGQTGWKVSPTANGTTGNT